MMSPGGVSIITSDALNPFSKKVSKFRTGDGCDCDIKKESLEGEIRGEDEYYNAQIYVIAGTGKVTWIILTFTGFSIF